MGIVFRQSVKTTIVTFTGALLGVVITFMYMRLFTQQEFGVVNNIIYQGVVIQVFLLLGTGSLLPVFIQRYTVDDQRRKVLTTLCMIVPLTATLLFSIPYFLLRQNVIALYNVRDHYYINIFYNYIPLLIIFWTYMTLLDMYLVSQMKVAVSSFVREVLLRLCNIALLGLFMYKLVNFYQFTVGSIFIYAIPPVVLFFIARSTKGFGLSVNWRVFKKADYKEMVYFSWYHLLLTASLNLMGYIDPLLLGVLDKKGLESLAVYRVALLVVSFMSIPYRSMTGAVFPTLNREYIANNMDTVRAIFQRSSINILIVSMAMFLLIGCNLPNLTAFISIITSRQGYESLAPIVVILMIGRIVDAATGMNNEVTSISKYYKFNFRVSILLLLLVILFDRLLIPRYGVFGAAWAATLSFIIFNVIKMLFLWRKMNIQPFTNKSVLVVIAGSVTGLVGYFLPAVFTNPIYNGIVRSIVILLVYGSMLFWLKPSPDLTAYLRSIKANKKLF